MVQANKDINRPYTGQKPRQPERMPKARTLALAHTMKKWLAVASLISFGTFGGVIAYHQIETATTTAAVNSSSTTSSTNPAASTTSSSQTT